MVDKDGRDYAERYSLISLCTLADSESQPEGLDVAGLCQQIEAVGLRPEHIFYNPANPQLPYSYWRGPVLLEFSNPKENMAALKVRAERLEEEINASVGNRDFDRFLALVDSRLAPELFMEVFNFIPDRDKFRLFEDLWRFNAHAHDIFPADFARRAYQYRGVTDHKPPADNEGQVRIYLRPASGIEPGQVQVWTTDMNRALQAAASIPAAPVYRAAVHREDIISYDGRQSHREVVVQPGTAKNLERMDLIDLADFAAEMETAGIIDQYRSRARQIKPHWFHQSAGIHGAGHTRRVLMLSLLLAYLERMSPADRDLLAEAAIYHDIGRENDGYDPGHGWASYNRTCREGLLPWCGAGEREVFRFILENHDLSDSKAQQRVESYQTGNGDRTWQLYAAFKDADGLDRVRLGDLNPDYLRTRSALRLLLVAYQLYFQPQWLERLEGSQGV